MLRESDLSVFSEQVVRLLWWVEVEVKECMEEECRDDWKIFRIIFSKYFYLN